MGGPGQELDPTKLPTGVVTFLLTDIEGSTSLWESEPATMKTALERHDAIVASEVARFDGSLLRSKGEGDSTFSVYQDASNAVAAAAAIRVALAIERWATSVPIRVRMAIHTGRTHERDRDYYGPVVNRCARLRAGAHGGQIIMSETTAELAGDSLPEGSRLRDLGRHRLKDLHRPERIFELSDDRVAVEFPPLRTLDQAAHNLPVELTSFVGRERELSELAELVGSKRVVTVTGAGGTGKTRLATHVGAEAVDRFPDGVRLASLAPIGDPALVPRTVASALDIPEQPGRAVVETLAAQLAGRRILIILDNCEHLTAACRDLVAMLVARTAVHVLATSREPLGVAGERLWPLDPLTLPDLSTGPAELVEAEAVRLFLDRAEGAGARMDQSPETTQVVASICRTLSGMPLAIELAAGRVRAIGLAELESRLRSQMLSIMKASAGDASTRTLEATLEWSYNLLTEDERILFRRTAIFSGGFTLGAAETVCGKGIAVLDTLPALCHRSLVKFDEEASRYHLLEPIRQYASARLAASDEQHEVAARHFQWCIQLTSRWVTGWAMEPVRPADVVALAREHDNLRAALDGTAATEDPGLTLRLAMKLAHYWIYRGLFDEGGRYLARAIEQAPSPGSGDVGRALLGLARIVRHQGEFAAAAPLVERAGMISRETGDLALACATLQAMASVELDRGREAEAVAGYEEALRLARESGDRYLEANSLNSLGEAARHRGAYPSAALHYAEAVNRGGGDDYMTAWAFGNLAATRLMMGAFDEARASALRSLELIRDALEPSVVGEILTVFAALRTSDDPILASRLLGAAARQRERGSEVLAGPDLAFSDHVTRIVRDAAGDVFEEAFEEGREISLEQAVVLALST